MNNNTTPTDPAAEERQQAAAAVLPVLTQLNQQAAALEKAAERGEQIDGGTVLSYELQAQHAQHLLSSGGLSANDVKEAAREQGGAQARAVAEALDHVTHTRSFEATPAEEERDVEEEREIDL
ncbi:hypothetical protein [Streptomyces geranii]|uniref:hypothetical protein n=1 Tax=Streptomyces geranii TaxID=2058923 RepID=UPI000D041E1F|nr:hypothetical protein [Streptomyces geranii]